MAIDHAIAIISFAKHKNFNMKNLELLSFYFSYFGH